MMANERWLKIIHTYVTSNKLLKVIFLLILMTWYGQCIPKGDPEGIV